MFVCVSAKLLAMRFHLNPKSQYGIRVMCKFCPSHSPADYRVTWLVHHPLSQQLTSAYGARIFHVGWNASKSYFALHTFQRLVHQNCCTYTLIISKRFFSNFSIHLVFDDGKQSCVLPKWHISNCVLRQCWSEAWNAPPTQNHLELANVVLHFCWSSQWCVGGVLRWSLPISVAD